MGSLVASASITERLARLVERTERLHALTAKMSAALRHDDVADLVIDESASALGAHSVGLWRVDEAEQRLVLERATNYPEEALALVRTLPVDANAPVADAVRRKEALFISSRAEYEAQYSTSGARTAAMSPSAFAVAALPIQLRDRVLGVLALTFLGERPFDDDERRFLTMLALHCAQGFERSTLYEAEIRMREVAEAATERARFLARASALLGSSLDYEQTLRNVAALAVPGIGDWCGVELVDPTAPLGTKQVAVAHIDPDKVQLAHDLRLRYPPNPNAKTGIPNILRTGKSELYAEIPDAMLVASAIDADHLRIMRELGLGSAMAVPVVDRGAVVGVITFIISNPRRRYTDEDLRMAEQLAERAGAAIGNARLYAEAKAAVQLRDDFLSIAGHELRTPISALALHLETQLQAPDGTPLDKLRARATKMLGQTARLSRLVEELLDVSRVSSGRLVLEVESFDLGQLVREIAERLREDFERAQCPVELDVHEVRGRWDRGRVDQIVMNLLTNATKYGKGKPVRIRVAQEDGVAVLVVADEGIGIAAEDHERIFERFERAVSPRKYGGLGLGLWITQQLVEVHGGSIAVDSRPDAGATFTVKLPLES
jgi:signal transduction histidine kinase